MFYFSGTKASLKIVQVGNWMLWAFRKYTSSSFLLEIPQSLPPLSSMYLMKTRFVMKLICFVVFLQGRGPGLLLDKRSDIKSDSARGQSKS